MNVLLIAVKVVVAVVQSHGSVKHAAMADIDLSTLNYMKLKRHLISMGIPKAEVLYP